MARARRPNKHAALLAANRDRYPELLAAQNGRCAMWPDCDNVPSPRRRFDLDHDHDRMVIRGLLCWSCNRAMPDGKSRAWLEHAADYMEGEA